MIRLNPKLRRVLSAGCIVILVFESGLMTSCDQSKHEGYSITDTKLHYRVHSLGDGEKRTEEGDVVLANIVVKDMRDSVLYNNTFGSFQSAYRISPIKNGGLNEAFSLLYEGDSASFIVEGTRMNLDDLSGEAKFNGKFSHYKMDIRLNRLFDPKQQELERNKSDWIQDMEMNEQILLNNFLKETQISETALVDGIYYVEHTQGEGHKIEGWETVMVHYQASFVNGAMFDDTYVFRDPLEFELGKPDQVIEGFMTGLKQMKVGGKATFVIPSYKAFGEDGSSTGIVPAYTTLVYDVELVGIK